MDLLAEELRASATPLRPRLSAGCAFAHATIFFES